MGPVELLVVLLLLSPFLLLGYWIARRGRRQCPTCGRRVPNGRTSCSCGHSFVTQ